MASIKVSEEFFRKFGKKFPPESYLATEGEHGSTMFLINSGKVNVIKSTPAGDKVLATLSEGDFFGEMALLGLQNTRAASVKTIQETTILELGRDAFEGLIRRSPEVAMSVIFGLASRVRDANGKVTALVHKDDSVRIASFLTHIVTDKGMDAPRPDPGRLAIASAETISSALGVSPDKIRRFFEMGKKARILATHGNWIWVPYPNYLLALGQHLATSL